MRRNILPDDMSFRIIRNPRRRNIALRIAPDGVFEVLSPPDVPEEFLSRLLLRRRTELEQLKQKTAHLRRAVPEFTEGELFALLGKFYPLHLSKRLKIFDGTRFIIPDGSSEEKSSHLISLYREIAEKFLLKRAEKISAVTALKPKKWRISSTERRWGSCSSSGTIALSWKLIQCPLETIDYVIIHELAHLQEMNHSPAFWRVVESYCPEFRRIRKQLNEFSRTLPLFEAE